MVRIRLKKFGSKNRKQWRIVVSDGRSPRDGRFIEEVGYYDPLLIDETIVVKQDRFDYWLSRGARPSTTVKSLIKRLAKKLKPATV